MYFPSILTLPKLYLTIQCFSFKCHLDDEYYWFCILYLLDVSESYNNHNYNLLRVLTLLKLYLTSIQQCILLHLSPLNADGYGNSHFVANVSVDGADSSCHTHLTLAWFSTKPSHLFFSSMSTSFVASIKNQPKTTSKTKILFFLMLKN